MRAVLLAVAGILISTSTFAAPKQKPEDAYMACMIGQSAVALLYQDKRDVDAAMETASAFCKEPESLRKSSEATGDFEYHSVDAIYQRFFQ